MDDQFDIFSLAWRIGFALALVLLTFNPTGHSYYHWLADGFPSVQPLEAVAGILLVIGWVVFVRSTLAAIGTLGLVLMLALFASIVWWMVSRGWLDVSNRSAMAWVVLLILGLVLGFGMSWSHIRRRLSGQAAVDRVDQ
jgi:glucan phosphoethanolaminetransferase (alkaline phosphatase superfamily)